MTISEVSSEDCSESYFDSEDSDFDRIESAHGLGTQKSKSIQGQITALEEESTIKSRKATLIRMRAESALLAHTMKSQMMPLPDLLDTMTKYGNNSDGIPALLYAAKMGDFEAVKLLIDHGADPFTRDCESRTALHFALLSKNLQVIEFFLGKGLDPNASDNISLPVWYQAVKLDDSKSFDLLIKAGLKINTIDSYNVLNENPALVALQHGSLDLLKLFLANGGILPQESIMNMNPVLWSICTAYSDCGKEKIECLKWLINKGIIDLKKFSDFDITNTYPEFLEYLIDNEYLQPNQKSANGAYPILRVLHNPALVRILINRGADVNVKWGDNGYGRSPLHEASNLETVKILLDNGADVNALDNFGRTPLFYANLNSGLKEIKNLLVENGAILKG